MTHFKTGLNIHAFDSDWQFPAITEEHAYHRIRDLGGLPDGFTYVAFPWATLIDKLERKAVGVDELRAIFKEFRNKLPCDTVKITVCQHIKCYNFMYLFRQAGIDHLFWSHAEHDSVKIARKHGIDIHPFPLYPVQLPTEAEAANTNRPHLYSFVGAKANQWYMTQARTWILEYLKDTPGSLVVGRESWHYNKVVYDHQVTGKAKEPEKLINTKSSDEFKKTLLESVFSLCPSGTGPNSIRLWESMGSGAIPVILADTHQLPGNIELWKQAVVFCPETPDAIKALPEKLRKIADDPNALAAMRQALRQLWMLYGRGDFVYGIRELVFDLAGQHDTCNMQSKRPELGRFLNQLLKSVSGKVKIPEGDSLLLLTTCASYLLLDVAGVRENLFAETPLRRAVGQARIALGSDHQAVLQINRLMYKRNGPKQVSPYVSFGVPPKVFLYGKHSHRTPLAYAPFHRLTGNAVAWANRAQDADLLVSGYTLDLRETVKELDALRKKNPNQKIAVISEEPLWDTIWSKGFTERDRTVVQGATEVPFSFLNHQTSDIFAFDKVPYFVATDDKFFLRYQRLFAGTSKRNSEDWRKLWQNAAQRYAFYAEIRENKAYDQAWKDLDVYGLSRYRTKVAQELRGDNCITVGQGWSDTAPRQKLVDWHLDKLASLNEQVAIVSGLENTHQKHYISEKIFDAFAVGAAPIYHASAEHRVFEFVPTGSFINCYGKTVAQSAKMIREFEPDAEFLERFEQAHQRLAGLFQDPEVLFAERRRVVRSLLQEIDRIC